MMNRFFSFILYAGLFILTVSPLRAQVTLTVTVKDAYLKQPLENAMAIWQSSGTSDTTFTDAQGIIHYVITPTGISDKENLPVSFDVSAAYPNPFQESTNADVSLGKSKKITYTVFNLLGQEVFFGQIPVQGPGKYQLHFDGLQSLAQGVYFLTINTPEGHKTVKIAKVGTGNGALYGPGVTLIKKTEQTTQTPSLQKVASELWQLTVTKAPYDTFTTTFTTPQQDTTIYVELWRNNTVHVVTQDDRGNPVHDGNKIFYFYKLNTDSLILQIKLDSTKIIKSGDYTVTSPADSNFYAFNQNVSLFSDTTLEFILQRKLPEIIIPDYSFTTKEDSAMVLDLNKIQFINCEKDTVYIIPLDTTYTPQPLGNDSFTITPKPDFNGQITFSVYAKAQHGTEKTQQFTGVFEEMTDFGGWIVDNQSYLPVPGKVVLFLANGQMKEIESDSTGFFKTQAEPQQTLDSLLVWHVKGDTANSFIVKYKNIPFDQDLINAGLFVTTYDSIIYGQHVADSLAVTPSLFRDYINEGNGYRMKSIDWEHVQNPVPNPNGPHGYVYWIDSDYYANLYPQYFRPLTAQEQNYIKNVIEQEVLAKIKEQKHKIPIYIAQPGEIPPLAPDGDVADGILIVYGNIGSNYDFGYKDSDNDGIIDVAHMGMGEPVFGHDMDITEETASIINPNPIYNPALLGKTKFHESGAIYHLAPIDIKQLRIEENIQNSTQTEILPYTLPNGTTIMRFYYPKKSHIDDILRLPNQ